MASRRGRYILVGVAVLLLASLWRTGYTERERHRLAEAYRQAQQQLQQAEAERAHLNGELVQAHQTIEEQAGNVNGLQQELKSLQDRLDKTTTDLTSLQREHEELHQRNDSLTDQLGAVTAEKQEMEAKLSSLKELRLAIRDVKRKMWNERWAAWRARIEALKAADQEQLALGNHGYVVHNGVTTLGSSEKLQVHVLQPQPQ